MQMESANASAAAAEHEVESLKAQLVAAKHAAAAAEKEKMTAKDESAAELRRLKESTEWDARRAADDFEAKEHELASLKRRHEEIQETLRATRADLASAREATLSRREGILRYEERSRKRGECVCGGAQGTRGTDTRQDRRDDGGTNEDDESSLGVRREARAAQGEVEKLTVKNKMLLPLRKKLPRGSNR